MENQNQNQHNMSPIAAGITGLIVGIVGTAAVAMADKPTRSRVTKKATGMKDSLEKWSKDTLHDLQATGEDMKKKSTSTKPDDFKTQSSSPADDAKLRLEEALKEDKKEL